MSKNTSFSLGDHFNGFVAAQVARGSYSSASDVVRAGLRLLEERENHLAALRAALIEGEESGISRQVDVMEIWEEVKKELQDSAHGSL